jgi:peptidoglycan/LPS O-acetylase OafA/YrhL
MNTTTLTVTQPCAENRTVPAYAVHLDAVRSLAALVVFVGHARGFFFSSGIGTAAGPQTAFQATVPTTTWGHQAVIVFFVLSGFLVGGGVLRSIAKGSWSWRQYAIHRMCRLWVVLIPALLLGFGLDHFGSTYLAGHNTIYAVPAGQIQIMPGLGAGLGWNVFLGNLAFLQPILVPTYGSNVALWSLAYEFWYYVLFPLATLAILGDSSKRRRATYAVLFFAILLFVGPKISGYFLIWGVGVVAAKIPRAIPYRWRRMATLGALTQFLAINVILRKTTALQLGLSDALLAVSFFALLYCLLNHRAPLADGAYKSIAQFLSKMSYTLYLTHYPALALACGLLVQPWHVWPKDLAHLFQFLGVLCIVYAYSLVVYFCFEAHTVRLRKCFETRLKKNSLRVSLRARDLSLVGSEIP